MDDGLGREIVGMYNASDAVYARGMIKGEIRGEERGMKKGREKGITEGEMKKAKEATFTLADRGVAVLDIAEKRKTSG